MRRLIFHRSPLATWLVRAAWLFLAIVTGAALQHFEVPPAPFFDRAFRGATAYVEQQRLANERLPGSPWKEARTDARGVTVHDSERSFGDFTIYLSFGAFEARLVNQAGDLIHTWRPDPKLIWTEARAKEVPARLTGLIPAGGHLFPNGDLLMLACLRRTTPPGQGLIKVDRAGKTLWSYLERHPHHDIDVSPDGRVYTLTEHISDSPFYDLDHPPPILHDGVAELSADGQELSWLSISEAIWNSPFRYLLATAPDDRRGSPLHTNAVRYVNAELAQRFPFAQEGQVVVSPRQLDALVVLDLQTKRATRAIIGHWRRGHDPDLLPNGNILLFDNLGAGGPAGNSRLIEFNPVTMAIDWQYRGTLSHPFHSAERGCQQRLPNGNTFVVESANGRLFEITADKEIVWEYYHPFRGGERKNLVPAMLWAQRYACDELSPEFRSQLESSGLHCR